MRYPNICPAVFVRRDNRFVARCVVEGREETVHVKNTGRCRELLLPGAGVWLTRSENPARRTAWDLVAVQKGDRLVNLDAAAPNAVFGEYVRAGAFLPGLTSVKPEVRLGASRLDFRLEAAGRVHYAEVKGVTLEEGGAVYFPDAPTERGVRHLGELRQAAAQGLGAHAVFVVQMEDVRWFSPNDRTHPAFGEALRQAAQQGVQLHAFWCHTRPDALEIGGSVEIRL